MYSPASDHPIHDKIMRLLEQLEPLGPTFVHIRLTGTEAHYLHNQPIHPVTVENEPYTSQHYFPASPVSSSVIILAKDIHPR